MAEAFSTNLGLSQLPEMDERKFPEVYGELVRMRNAIRVLQSALDTYTGALGETQQDAWSSTGLTTYCRLQNISRIYVIASEAISQGRVVNLYNNAGVLTARNASATDNTKPARAYCSTGGGVASGAFGEFILLGLNPLFSGLTPGTKFYLSTTPGVITTTAPSTSGNLVQEIGYALDSSNLFFNPTLVEKVVP